MERKMGRIFIFQVILSVFFLNLAFANPDSVIVPGDLRIIGAGNGLVFPDGSIQYKAEVAGPVGPQGPAGPQGVRGYRTARHSRTTRHSRPARAKYF